MDACRVFHYASYCIAITASFVDLSLQNAHIAQLHGKELRGARLNVLPPGARLGDYKVPPLAWQLMAPAGSFNASQQVLRSPLQTASSAHHPKFHVGDRVKGIHTGKLGTVMSLDADGDPYIMEDGADEGKAYYAKDFDAVAVGKKRVHPLLTKEDAVKLLPVDPVCKKDVPHEERIMLIGLSYPFHGSTALEGLLMSSNSLATLCSAGHWQCEGRGIMKDAGWPDGKGVKDWDFSTMLKLYSQYWDVRRPVMFEKSPNEMAQVEDVRAGLLKAKLPNSMTQLGVKRLSLGYVLLWRPICLAQFSSHAEEDIKQMGEYAYVAEEVHILRRLVHQHAYLTSQGEGVLVINLADLMWRSNRNRDRLGTFLPCLGKLDTDYVPKKGVDVIEGNQWKADGSAKAFGESIDPTGFYDIEEQTCKGNGKLVAQFKDLPEDLKEKLDASLSYLSALS